LTEHIRELQQCYEASAGETFCFYQKAYCAKHSLSV